MVQPPLDPSDATIVWRAPERVAGPVPLGPADAGAGADRSKDAPRNPKVLIAESAPGVAVRRLRRSDTAPLVAWVASVVLLVALVVAAYAWRDRIMAAWPPSERLYAALGLMRAPSSVGH